MKCRAIAAAWFSSFFENAFVNRVNRRIPIRIVIREGIILWGTSIPKDRHLLAAQGKWDELKSELCAERGKTKGSLATTRTMAFYEQTESAVWTTFHHGLMWWCNGAQSPTFHDNSAAGSAGIIRHLAEGSAWRATDLNGRLLEAHRISGQLTWLQTYRKSIELLRKESNFGKTAACALQTIIGEPSDISQQTERAISNLEYALGHSIRSLHWHDFEVLVDLIFARSGWYRESELGEQMKDVDLVLMCPITHEKYGVQVKSAASLAVYRSSQKAFDAMRKIAEFRDFYFVVHSPTEDLERFTPGSGEPRLWRADDVARQAIRAGLASWIMDKSW